MKTLTVILLFLWFLFAVNEYNFYQYKERYNELYGEMTSVERINLKMSGYMGDCWRQYKDKTGQEYEQQVDGGWFNDELQNRENK